ncbi:prevent-host-death protein [Lactobacillus sp. PFC-70]|nr:prevent-host-death protein [Lactobacillus sp. PFC-70]
MEVTTYSRFRKNPKRYLDQATYNYEPVTITRKNAPNAVVLSADVYTNLLENQFIQSNETNLKWILAGVQQIEKGQITQSTRQG